MLKIRRSRDRLIFNMGIPIPGKDGLYIETGPWIHPSLAPSHQYMDGLLVTYRRVSNIRHTLVGN